MKNTYRIIVILLTLLAVVPTQAKREKRSVVRMETTAGVIRIALSDDTPLHRDNFLRLASEGFYDGTLFHRVISGFMIQGGDPDSRQAAPGQPLGEGDTGYTIEAEFNLPYLYHWRGAVAAARESDDVNPEQRSSGCQFYIVWGKKHRPADIKKVRATLEERGVELTPQMRDDYEVRGGTPHLDGAYTVFGEVIEGLDVVKEIQSVPTDSLARPLEDIRIIRATVESRSKASREVKLR